MNRKRRANNKSDERDSKSRRIDQHEKGDLFKFILDWDTGTNGYQPKLTVDVFYPSQEKMELRQRKSKKRKLPIPS